MSEKSLEVVREAIMNYAEHVDARLPRTFVRADYVGRDRSTDAQVMQTMEAACAKSDEFERESIELMYIERNGDPRDLPWFKK